jgi:hypothetical protein
LPLPNISLSVSAFSHVMGLAEIKEAVDALSAGELAELAAFIRQRDDAAWVGKLTRRNNRQAGRQRRTISRSFRSLADHSSGGNRDRTG